MSKTEINVVWFKRDLRVTDNNPLFYAAKSKTPLLLVYFFEPSVINHPDSNYRHWRFVFESIKDLNKRLTEFNTQIFIFHQEVKDVFAELTKEFSIQTVFSHQEIGNDLTFCRDKEMKVFFNENTIKWKEYQTNGIIRGLKNRDNWQKLWKEFMYQEIQPIALETINFYNLTPDFYQKNKGIELNAEITNRNLNFQEGGETLALKYLTSFLKERHVNYSKHISKPFYSRKSCSRLSPYLAYGNVSMRFIYQSTLAEYANSTNKRALSNFVSRLHWHCHFIQKFESQSSYEFQNINKAFNAIIKTKNENLIKAWQEGNTGFPLVDACMRCLVQTGYINFRMRAMVVSFFVFNLWQDWRELHFLAQQFLDYEPGIHYPQLQMQSGTTGINTLRIYNPVKNSITHDADALFIKKWLPELANIPNHLVHEPYKLNAIEQQFYECEMGKDYPLPIVDLEESRKYATTIMWGFRKTAAVKTEAKKILAKHVKTKK